MGKAILVIDMPDSCDKCHICASYAESAFSIREYWCTAFNNKDVKPYTKPDWCPLKPVPEKRHQPQYQGNGVFGYRTAMVHEYARGWNECIDYFLSE